MQFIDLAAQQVRIKEKIDARIQAVLAHGKYIMGPEVKELEVQLAAWCGAKHAISCANGTDALQLALMALGARKGDAVFVPSFTFAATAEVVPCMGATPVLVDCDPRTYNMSPASLKRSIVHAKTLGLRPSIVIPVDLFGLPADYDAIAQIADAEGLTIVSDSAQGWGSTIDGRMTGTFGRITTTSFFPAKPLGCYGDGGALFTDDDELANVLQSMRVHGKGEEKYDNVRIGMNSRLDTLQAGILLEKLAVYADEIDSRNRIAEYYTTALGEFLVTPYVPDGYQSIWAQYTLAAHSCHQRAVIMDGLQAVGVPSVIYYPKPLHQQSAYRSYPRDPHGLPVSTDVASRVFSLPMHPYLTQDQIQFIVARLKSVIGQRCEQ